MTNLQAVWRLTGLWVVGTALILGCGRAPFEGGSPVSPANEERERDAMWFNTGVHTILGELPDNPAADVDLATVVWGQISAGEGSGDIVVFPDDTSWVVAVGIVEDPTNEDLPSQPYLRFLSSDGQTMTDPFPVGVLIQDGRYCRHPKVDCTYLGAGMTEVVVVYRHGEDGWDWNTIESTWDIRVARMIFRYITNQGWVPVSGTIPMRDAAMIDPLTGQTHPDIVYDQNTGDIYCAWSVAHHERGIEVVYERHDFGDGNYTWQGPFSLEDGTAWGDFDGWYVNLDVGIVEGLPNTPAQRLVGFVYTGHFFPDSPYWGFRPIVGWWSIEGGPIDSDHPPLIRLVVNQPGHQYSPIGVPEHYHAGMIRLDIPRDNAPQHGGTVVFVQDTENEEDGRYEVFGISSLDYSSYTWLSDPDDMPDPFNEATLPSVAVHEGGATAAATFFATSGETDWQVYAVHWIISSAGSTSAPTIIDATAEGEFEFDPNDFMLHNWGTCSSLVSVGDTTYWGGWSDKLGGASEPHLIRGAMGFANL